MTSDECQKLLERVKMNAPDKAAATAKLSAVLAAPAGSRPLYVGFGTLSNGAKHSLVALDFDYDRCIKKTWAWVKRHEVHAFSFEIVDFKAMKAVHGADKAYDVDAEKYRWTIWSDHGPIPADHPAFRLRGLCRTMQAHLAATKAA